MGLPCTEEMKFPTAESSSLNSVKPTWRKNIKPGIITVQWSNHLTLSVTVPSPPSCSFLWRTVHSPLLRGRHTSSEAWGGFWHQPRPCCHHFQHHDVHQAHHGCHHLSGQREWEQSFPKVVVSRQPVVIANLTVMTHHPDLKTGLHLLLRSPNIWLHMSIPLKMYVVMSPFDYRGNYVKGDLVTLSITCV